MSDVPDFAHQFFGDDGAGRPPYSHSLKVRTIFDDVLPLFGGRVALQSFTVDMVREPGQDLTCKLEYVLTGPAEDVREATRIIDEIHAARQPRDAGGVAYLTE